ncbi:unnamed protein product [Caenorhabditis angaria]|uniref:Uncharacterized protein n=1 Tax=Caenorhabditis angaria TaxID=860376 RepID=A0A9P1MV28_9PELO|nr:unnamed protein product [Caenorhabditis angaria]
MSIVKQSLFAVALLSVAMVESAPVDSSNAAAVTKKTSKIAKTKSFATNSPRRAKRSNIVVEEVEEDPSLGAELADEIEEEQLLRDQLSELSDNQLAMLAEYVQNEINRFDPTVDAYEIIEIPEYVTRRNRRAAIPEQVYEIELPRSDADLIARAQAEALAQQQEAEEDQDEIIFVPEDVFLEAVAQEAEEEEAQKAALDEYELSQRIAEIAAILNERATRRVRYF